MIITTKNGFTCELDPATLDDMELLEMIGDVQDGNTLRVPAVIEKMLGKKQKKALYDHVRGENGRVPTGIVFDMMGEIFELINEANETKN